MSRKELLTVIAIFVVCIALVVLWRLGKKVDPVSQYVSPSYRVETVFDDANEGSTSIVVLTEAVENPVFERINKQIRKRLLEDSCFGDPRGPNATYNLQSTYIDIQAARTTPNTTARNVDGLSYEATRQYLIHDYNFYQHIAPTVIFAEQGVLSIEVSYDMYCGGPYPSSGTFGMNFDLKTGHNLAFKDVIRDYETNQKAVETTVFNYAAKVSPPQEGGGCDYSKDSQGDALLSADYFEYVVSRDGLMMLSFGYPHAMRDCDPSGTITVPYALLNGFLSPDAPLPRK